MHDLRTTFAKNGTISAFNTVIVQIKFTSNLTVCYVSDATSPIRTIGRFGTCRHTCQRNAAKSFSHQFWCRK